MYSSVVRPEENRGAEIRVQTQNQPGITYFKSQTHRHTTYRVDTRGDSYLFRRIHEIYYDLLSLINLPSILGI